MCPYHIRPTGPIVAPLDRRDPDYDKDKDLSIDDQIDIMMDIVEEQWRERKMDDARRDEKDC